jgi:hypothetical protein
VSAVLYPPKRMCATSTSSIDRTKKCALLTSAIACGCTSY